MKTFHGLAKILKHLKYLQYIAQTGKIAFNWEVYIMGCLVNWLKKNDAYVKKTDWLMNLLSDSKPMNGLGGIQTHLDPTPWLLIILTV